MDSKTLEKRYKVAEILQSARVQKGMTQQELADLCGYSKSTVTRIERGKFSPNADQLYNMCDILDLALEIGGKRL